MTTASYIQINGEDIYRPREFKLEREDIYKGGYTTCTGKYVADRVGWRYADTTLSWDALPQSMIEVLISMSGESTLTFTDADGEEYTESVIRSSAVYMQHRHTVDGVTYWTDVECGVRFIDAHD